ncbi:Glycosyltransferase, GT2 family [Aquipseudomonas alcaligenes]|nr:Glycosyltransferase, GT2 family [Pseudomonas alcaligenes]
MRVRRLRKILEGAIAHGGGWRLTLLKTAAVWRNEGMAGLRCRLSNLGAVAGGAPVTDARGDQVLRNDYQEWLRRYHHLDEPLRQRIRQRIDGLVKPPLISVVMPVFKPNHDWLIAAIDSVRNQLYPHWQLCIADDASPDGQVSDLLAAYAAREPRIRFVQRATNGHISAASNSALALAEGSWIALLDQDDLLAEHALYLAADSILQHPQAQLLYSDEDKIDERGRRHSPYFKSAWNQDLFYSHNLITHLGLYRRSLVEEVGGFRTGFEGAQDYDLALRCIERLEPSMIVHIPHVLYHWRSHAASTAASNDAKPYAMQAGERALREHFARLGSNCAVSGNGHGYRTRHELPTPAPLASIVVTSRNAATLLNRCITSILRRTRYPDYEVVLIDNDSNDPAALDYLASLAEEPRVHVLRHPGPFNYSALNNFGVSHARGQVICLLNNDTEVLDPDWLDELVSHAIRPGIGAVGAKLLYPNGSLQHAGIVLGIGGWAGHAHKGQPGQTLGRWGRAALTSNFSAVTGACLAMRKALYQELGGLNENELAVACSDVDLCLRAARQGQRSLWTPHARLYHHESATRGYDTTPEKSARLASEVAYMRNHWDLWLANDPYYNPNLSLEHEDFSLAWPPRVNLAEDTSAASRTHSPACRVTSRMTQQNAATFTPIKRTAPEFDQCQFYHSADLGPGREVLGPWDLRTGVDAYLGHQDFAGRSVLEIGPASGFLSFHMERMGAKVTAIEPSMQHLWDIVPLAGFDLDKWREEFSGNITGVRNSFWYLHDLYQSKVELIETDPLAIPEAVGEFDIGLLAAVLLHCRSPFSLIESLSRRVRKTMIITELYDSTMGDEPLCRLIPQPAIRQVDTWWSFSPAFIVNALGVLGFEGAQVTVHHQHHRAHEAPVPMFTVVAHRP